MTLDEINFEISEFINKHLLYSDSPIDFRSYYTLGKVITNGKIREIHKPIESLARIQRLLSEVIYQIFIMPGCLHSIPGRSIISNAEAHIGAKHLLKIDIKDYYNSIMLAHIPDTYLLTKSRIIKLGFTRNYIDGESQSAFLPTGAPSSPAIANVVGLQLDKYMSRVADVYGYTYTRYLDDLTFSSPLEEYDINMVDTIYRLIQQLNFEPNLKKTRWYFAKDPEPFRVTGINLPREGVKHRIPASIRRVVRGRLSHCRVQHSIDPVTAGYLSFIRSVEPELYDTYMKEYCLDRATSNKLSSSS